MFEASEKGEWGEQNWFVNDKIYLSKLLKVKKSFLSR